MRRPEGSLREPIIRTLAYFSLWQHPLTVHEIQRYLPVRANLGQIEDELYVLQELGIVREESGFYLLPGRASVASRRHGQVRADAERLNVTRHVRLVSQFPFVRSVCLTGSYAKHVLIADADIDYLIVTEPGRLWLARTLLILYKKIVLRNSFEYFCLNYFVDTNHLQFAAHNMYTAVEVASMLPVFGIRHYYRCWSANDWLHGVLPNARALALEPGIEQKDSRLKRVLERVLGLKIFDRLESALMHFTQKTWRTRFPLLPAAKRDVLFESTPHVSRHHPIDYNEMVPKLVEQVIHAVREERALSV
jgi:hypothetical protein